MSGPLLTDDLDYLLPGEVERHYDDGYKYIKIPLWLVLKYPQIINPDGINEFTVNTQNSIKALKEFNDFMFNFTQVHLGYLTPMHGKQKINSYIMTKHFIDNVSFTPEQYIRNINPSVCARKTFKERMLSIEKWSYLKVEHRLKYENFLKSFFAFSNALSKYYQTHYNLSDYADQANNIISYYVCHHTEVSDYYYDPIVVNFIALLGIDKINDLKPFIKTLGPELKGEFLRHAVVANLNLGFISWLIKNGADIDYKFHNQTALMASFRNIEVMEFLLKHGANIEAKNKENETALFYSIGISKFFKIYVFIESDNNLI